jgi:hypothetical protein
MALTVGLFLALRMQMKNQAQTIEKTSDGHEEGDVGLATASRSADAPSRPPWLELQNTATVQTSRQVLSHWQPPLGSVCQARQLTFVNSTVIATRRD